MATQLDPNVKDDLKTQFVTREGTYRLLTLSEYSRPNRVGYTNNQSSPQVRVSIVTLPNPPTTANSNSGTCNSSASNGANGGGTSHNRPLTNGNNLQTALNGANCDGFDVQSSSSLNGQQSQYVVPSSMDARLGAGMSMHTMMNGSGVGGLDQNGLSASQVLGGDRICFNFGRELYVYAFRGVKKVGIILSSYDFSKYLLMLWDSYRIVWWEIITSSLLFFIFSSIFCL